MPLEIAPSGKSRLPLERDQSSAYLSPHRRRSRSRRRRRGSCGSLAK